MLAMVIIRNVKTRDGRKLTSCSPTVMFNLHYLVVVTRRHEWVVIVGYSGFGNPRDLIGVKVIVYLSSYASVTCLHVGRSSTWD